jgi:hypothetical protein
MHSHDGPVEIPVKLIVVVLLDGSLCPGLTLTELQKQRHTAQQVPLPVWM